MPVSVYPYGYSNDYKETWQSLYSLVIQGGYFSGTIDEWLDSLKNGRAFRFTDFTTEQLASLKGAKGDTGSNIELQVGGGYIQWRPVGGTSWYNLVAMSALVGATGGTGATGQTGANGATLELQVAGGHIQWRPVGTSTWFDLIAVSAITGANGADGANGTNGTNGTNGSSVEIQVSGGYIQWRLVGGSSWTNIIATSTLVGATGATGSTGATGKGISSTSYNAGTGVLTITYTDTTTFQTGDLRGANGSNGTNGTNGRGISSSSYNSSTGILTITYTDSSTFNTGDLRNNSVEININFLDTTPFIYNVPQAMTLSSVSSEGTAPSLSISLGTGMSRYTKLTITPAVVGLVTLYGTLT